MGRCKRLVPAVLAACALMAAPAAASSTQEMIMQDDQWLIYSPAWAVKDALQTMKSLGVDRVRVSVVWGLVAPSPNSSKAPRFDADDPNAYPPGAWSRWDTLVALARQVGVKLYFELTAPAPKWATTPRALRQGYRWSHDPNAKEFGQFAEAVGRRYAGLVNYWSIWNEPNIGGWMTPQWRTVSGGQQVEASAAIYRALLDAAWKGLVASGHGHDTILIGETAAYGFAWRGYGADMSPLTFLRALYCVSPSYRPLTGTRAGERGCPRAGKRAAFVAAHPALFSATGWAHHPYDFNHGPWVHLRDPGAADLADLGRIERALDRAQRAYGSRRRLPLYLTEWGYESNPPDRFGKFTPAEQAQYLNEGAYLAWRDPRVRAFGQFLLVDSAPFSQYRKGTRAYWSSFQTGLYRLDFTPKPALAAFRLPIWLPRRRPGSSVPVWGRLPLLTPGRPPGAAIEFRPLGSHTWAVLTTIRSVSSEGYFQMNVAIRGLGVVRLAWWDPAIGGVEFSRSVAVG